MLLKRFLQAADVDTVNLGLEHTVRVRADKKTIRVMNEQEQQKLEAELEQEDNGNKYLAVSLALKMGLLIGEICGLRWTDIDFAKGTVKIQNTVQRIQNNGAEGKKTILVAMPVAESIRYRILYFRVYGWCKKQMAMYWSVRPERFRIQEGNR